MLFKDPHEDNSFFLQVHHSQKDALLKTLKKYKIRKKVKTWTVTLIPNHQYS